MARACSHDFPRESLILRVSRVTTFTRHTRSASTISRRTEGCGNPNSDCSTCADNSSCPILCAVNFLIAVPQCVDSNSGFLMLGIDCKKRRYFFHAAVFSITVNCARLYCLSQVFLPHPPPIPQQSDLFPAAISIWTGILFFSRRQYLFPIKFPRSSSCIQ